LARTLFSLTAFFIILLENYFIWGLLIFSSPSAIAIMLPGTIGSRFLKSSKTTSSLIGNVVVREHIFSFPLDWREVDIPTATKIDVFVREVSSSSAVISDAAILYLQGGPGFPSPRPTNPVSGWMKVALDKGHRILLLDQRGTGLSTAMNVQRLMHLEKQGGLELQLQYLTNMRSDAIADDVDVSSSQCTSRHYANVFLNHFHYPVF
jgi:hypothetical protein